MVIQSFILISLRKYSSENRTFNNEVMYYSIRHIMLSLVSVSKLRCWAIGTSARTDKVVGTAARHCSKHCHRRIPCKHSNNLCKRCSMSDLTLQNFTERDVDEATRWQSLKHAVGEVNTWTGANRLKNGRGKEQSNRVHQSICHSSNDNRLVTVVNTNKLKAEAESNYRLVDKVSNKNCPNL